MKKIFLSLSLFIVIGLLSCFDKDVEDANPCKETTSEENVPINVFDFNAGSPYYNQAVSVFNLKKQKISRSGNCNSLPLSECSNALTIQNTTSKKISFSFVVEYKLNLYYWTYQNTVTIEPNATANMGVMNDNCGSLGLASIVVRLTNVSYQ